MKPNEELGARCYGQCHTDGTCAGDVRRVEVFDHKGSWGKFNYCQTARECDERNGYRIEDADNAAGK